MNDAATLGDLDAAAERLSDPDASFEQKVEALDKLEQGLSGLSVEATSDSDRTRDQRNLARNVQIAGLTQLGELSELAALENLLDAETRQGLHALCGQPMSSAVEADFVAMLDQATHAAQAAAARLQEIRAQTERGRSYRDLVGNMLELLNLLCPTEKASTDG